MLQQRPYVVATANQEDLSVGPAIGQKGVRRTLQPVTPVPEPSFGTSAARTAKASRMWLL